MYNYYILNACQVQFVATHLPNVWVINDDYILSRYKSNVLMEDGSQLSEKSINSHEFWRTRPTTKREQNLLGAIQEIPLYDAIADAFKLDILFEDYLQEVSKHLYSRVCILLKIFPC